MIRDLRTRTLPSAAWPVLILVLVLCLAGCREDDPTTPVGGAEPWQEVRLETDLGNSALLAVDFWPGGGMALGYGLRGSAGAKAVYAPSLLTLTGDGWSPVATDGLPDVQAYMDLALDGAGGLVLVGFDSGDTGCRLVDDRGFPRQTLERQGAGLLAVDGDGGFFVAGGHAPSGKLMTSLAFPTWTTDTLPLSGQGESGFVDVDVRGGVAVAVGFDDGADVIPVLLRRTVLEGWQQVDLGGVSRVTLHSVALTADGAIFAGGVQDAGGLEPRAWLAVRSAAGGWTQIVLPDPGLVGAVNDILVTTSGSVVIACSGEVSSNLATIFRADASGVVREVTPFAGHLFQLGEAADGRLFAVGMRYLQNGVEKALLLQR